MLKKITVEEAVMLIVKKETGKLYVKQKYSGDYKQKYSGDYKHHYVHFRDTNIKLQQLTSQEFWLMTDDE